MDELDIIFEDEIDVDNTKDLYKETYSLLDNYNEIKSKLNDTMKELKISNLKYDTLDEEYEKIKKKFEEEIKKYNEEVKSFRKELVEKNKNIIMLKTILELIIRNYGMENVSKITRLNSKQINKYLK